MSADKYPCIFSRQMEAIVYISDMPDIGDFIRRSAKIAIAAPGTPGDFRRSPRSAKIARCVTGFSLMKVLTQPMSRTSAVAVYMRFEIL